MFKVSTSGIPVSLNAGVSTSTMFESGNFVADTLKAEIIVVLASDNCPSAPPAISRNFLGSSFIRQTIKRKVYNVLHFFQTQVDPLSWREQ